MVEMPSNSKNIPGLYIKHESNEGSWVRGSTSTNYSKNDLDYHRKLAFHGKENDILKKNEGIIPRYAGKRFWYWKIILFTLKDMYLVTNLNSVTHFIVKQSMWKKLMFQYQLLGEAVCLYSIKFDFCVLKKSEWIHLHSRKKFIIPITKIPTRPTCSR